eukprot:gnl/Trimastix_PCT/281.p1 GENE.gnl/Trimastix_PCT/281~~gnl/Trimastix_PCT/281.p1  ORF type:complete len:191 (+),score=42.40 gnl/Trimastix_PCT/281:86-658(+)
MRVLSALVLFALVFAVSAYEDDVPIPKLAQQYSCKIDVTMKTDNFNVSMTGSQSFDYYHRRMRQDMNMQGIEASMLAVQGNMYMLSFGICVMNMSQFEIPKMQIPPTSKYQGETTLRGITVQVWNFEGMVSYVDVKRGVVVRRITPQMLFDMRDYDLSEPAASLFTPPESCMEGDEKAMGMLTTLLEHIF